MEVTTKYVVLEEKYATWIITKAKKMYSSVYKEVRKQNELDQYIATTFEMKTLVQSQNDFTIQTIMAFYNDEPVASLIFNTFPRNRDNFKDAEKPLFIDKIIYDTEPGLHALLEKVKTIASQQNYDIIFGELLVVRDEAIKLIEKNGFEITAIDANLGTTNLPVVVFKWS